MELFKPLSPVISVFLLIGVGFLFAHWKKINLASVTDLIVYIATPCLVFTNLARRPLFASDLWVLIGGIVVIFASVGLLIKFYFLIFRFHSRGFALPSLFMNAGNMGIPLALFAMGPPGMQRATLLFVIITSFQYTLGIYILSGRGNWTEIFRLPFLYATVAGLACNLAEMQIPELVFQPLSLLGQSTIPMMLVSLGYRLHDFRSLQWGHAIGGALVRLVGGFAAAWAAVLLVGADSVNRQVLLLYGSLPAAVINFVLTEKYGQDPGLAASIVVLSTFLSFFWIPVVFWLIL